MPDLSGDTLIVFEPFTWSSKSTHYQWGKEMIGEPFICPSDMPEYVFKGLLSDRLIGHKSAQQIDEDQLIKIIEDQHSQTQNEAKDKFHKALEEVTEAALSEGGTLSSDENFNLG